MVKQRLVWREAIESAEQTHHVEMDAHGSREWMQCGDLVDWADDETDPRYEESVAA